MTEINNMEKPRDRAIDVAKGILILLLVVYHFAYFAVRKFGTSNSVVDAIYQNHGPLATCYFMQAFFVITGMCSNFDGPIGRFVVKQIKTLLVPAFVFSVANSLVSCVEGRSIVPLFGNVHHIICHGYSFYWFCVALFCGKITYRLVHQVVKNSSLELLLLLLLSILGSFLHSLGYGLNYAAHQQVLDLTVFLAFGHIFGRQIRMAVVGAMASILYCLLICLVKFMGGLPYVMGDFNTTLITWPLHIMLATTGSVAVLVVGRILSMSAISDLLEALGKSSLVIYLTQYRLLTLQLAAFGGILNGAALKSSIVVIGSITLSVLCFGCIMVKILRVRARFVLGVF